MKATNTEPKRILVLLFSPTGRDAEAVIPLCYYLEKIYGYKLKYGSVFDGRYLIDSFKPHALLLTNIGGAEFNVEAADYAYSKGIKVLSLTAEGLFRENELDEFVWGNNTKRKINWHKMYVWSNKYFNFCVREYPSFKTTFDISGSTGLDRYKVYKFPSKGQFLSKYKKHKYKKVIMYAGFSFGFFFDDKRVSLSKYREDEVEFYKKDMKLTKDILQELISKNKDVLFIFKKHPAEDNKHMEIDYNWNFDNLLIFNDQVPIANLINICDLYFIYRSTTSFEAYALGKTVINIFPSSHKSYEQEDQKGNHSIKNYKQAQEAINEFYKVGHVNGFKVKNKIRIKIIKDSVFSIDGFNSFRTADKIDKFLRNSIINTKKSFSPKGLIFHHVLKFNRLLFIVPRFRRSEILRNYNGFPRFHKLKQEYDPQIKKFYQRGINPKRRVLT